MSKEPNHLLTDQTVLEVVKAGRTRWKGENENWLFSSTPSWSWPTTAIVSYAKRWAHVEPFDIRPLTLYLCFDSWSPLLAFMIQQLELQPDTDTR